MQVFKMPANSEVEQEILNRAERRRKQLMEALGSSVLTPNNLLSSDKESFEKVLNEQKYQVETKVRFNGGKENQLPVPVPDLLYPARPARSVYNSPLIKSNRSPLWKSPPPPPYTDQSSYSDRSSPCTTRNREESKAKRPIFPKHDSYFRATVRPDNESENSTMTPLSSTRALKLYPSLPRADQNTLPRTEQNDIGKSLREEKNLKEHANRSTASAARQGGQEPSLPCTKKSSTIVASDQSPTRSKDSCSVDLRKDEKRPDETPSENDIEDTYDMDRFLEEALGSALHLNSTMAEETVTDYSGEDSFHSIETYRTPDRIHTTSTLRSSMRFVKPTPEVDSQRDGVNDLLREAETQQQVMAQASKALTICRSSKAFFNSSSLVDAERLLLLATLRHTAVLDEIRGLLPSPSRNPTDFRGRLQILEVSAPLKEDPLKWGKAEHDRDLWFLCVLCYGRQILASEPVAYETGAKCITFTGNLELTDLPASFVASLQIYTLRTYKPQPSIHKSKLIKVCKLLRRRSRSCLDSSGSEQLLHLRTPAFALTGSASIDLSKVVDSKPRGLHLGKVPLMSPFKGSAWVRMKTSLTSSASLGGFLTVLEKTGGCHSWQRRWCFLSELSLHFWNYPADQDEKVPLETIDLRDLSSEKVVSAPRHLCARPRTLMLEAVRSCGPNDMNSTLMECNVDFTVVRYFLSCDSGKDLAEWTSTLNKVLSSIKAWNIRKFRK